MLEYILFFLHYALLLVFGVFLSFIFAGSTFTKKTFFIFCSTCLFCGIAQLIVFQTFGSAVTWKMYPLIVHVPLVFVSCAILHNPLPTSLAAISTAYLCCHPAKWIGLLIEALTHSQVIAELAQILTLICVIILCYFQVAPALSTLYNKRANSIILVASIPMGYYLFDYTLRLYPSLWGDSNPVTAEFLPFFLCIMFLIFSLVYYHENESRIESERIANITRIASLQVSNEIETIKKSMLETQLLRHDMRHLLNSLSVCLQQNDIANALHLIDGYEEKIDATAIQRYCKNDTFNYVLKNFASKCADAHVDFHVSLQEGPLPLDEISFLSIVSNALENALHAQSNLPKAQRQITFTLRYADKKMLLSIRNPVSTPPLIRDGLPVTEKSGHGYGTQSIRYLTARLGGKCQFLVEKNMFILRIVI